VSTPGANGTLYGGYDLDNAVRGMYQERYRKNPQSVLLDLKSANKTAAGKIASSVNENKKKRKKKKKTTVISVVRFRAAGIVSSII